MNSRVLILTEAGKDIGLGHYTRCSALQEALEESEEHSDMLINANGVQIDGPSRRDLNWIAQLDWVLQQSQYNTVIVDSYLADSRVYQQLSQRFYNVVAIDDYNRIDYPVKFVLNPNVFFSEMDYSNQSATCVGGKDYIILRKAFRSQDLQIPSNETVSQLLITIGGTDFRNILPVIIKTCATTSIPKIVVIAPMGLDLGEKDDRIHVFPAQDATSMRQHILVSDIVISACGQTLHELAAVGRATIGICLDIDQVLNQRYYLSKGFLPFDLQWFDSELSNKILVGLNGYESKECRDQVAKLSASLINMDGVTNVASWINNLQHEYQA